MTSSLPRFEIGQDPGPNFPELLRRVGLPPFPDAGGDAVAARLTPPAVTTSVHGLQDRAAKAGREIARHTRRRVASAGAVRIVADDDWSDF